MFKSLSAAELAGVKAKRKRIFQRYGQWAGPSKTDYHLNLYNRLRDGREYNLATDFADSSMFGPAHEIVHKLEMIFRYGIASAIGDNKGHFTIEHCGNRVRLRYLDSRTQI